MSVCLGVDLLVLKVIVVHWPAHVLVVRAVLVIGLTAVGHHVDSLLLGKASIVLLGLEIGSLVVWDQRSARFGRESGLFWKFALHEGPIVQFGVPGLVDVRESLVNI